MKLMKHFSLYLDTSVIGGCFDKEFQKYSNVLIEQILSGNFTALISDITVDEIIRAPQIVQTVLNNLIDSDHVEHIEATPEMYELAQEYLDAKIVTPKYKEDALHIAIATINRADLLVSWNFKHIVNFRRIHQFNAVNLSLGYAILDIRSPMEVITLE